MAEINDVLENLKKKIGELSLENAILSAELESIKASTETENNAVVSEKE